MYSTPALTEHSFIIILEGQYKRQSNGHMVREGKGVHTLPNGVTYDGQWQSDKMNGKGIMM